MNSQPVAQAPADRLLERRRRQPNNSFTVSPEGQRLGAEYAEQMDRGEFDYDQLARDVRNAS